MKLIVRKNEDASLLFEVETANPGDFLHIPLKGEAVYYKGAYIGEVTSVFNFYEEIGGFTTVHVK